MKIHIPEGRQLSYSNNGQQIKKKGEYRRNMSY
jgi:hypothetical protein